MRILSTSTRNLSVQQERPKTEADPRDASDELDLVPAVADRIKAFEDLIQRASRSESKKDCRAKSVRSHSCPAVNTLERFHLNENVVTGMPPSLGPRLTGANYPYYQQQQPSKQQNDVSRQKRPNHHRPLDTSNGSNLSLFSGSTSSGYTSTTPPSPEPDLASRYHLTSLSHVSPLLDDDEEEKQIELEMFSNHRSSRFFSATSTTEDEVEVDEDDDMDDTDDMDDIHWSELESEIDDIETQVVFRSAISDEVSAQLFPFRPTPKIRFLLQVFNY